MSAKEIIEELPKLTEAERRDVLQKLRALSRQSQESPVGGQAQSADRLEEESAGYRLVDLTACGIGEAQAADLRARLKTFAEDWDRPEAAIYDEDPAR